MDIDSEKLREIARHVEMVEIAAKNGTPIPREILTFLEAFRLEIHTPPCHDYDRASVLDRVSSFSSISNVKIKWDRVVNDDGKVTIYGWIERTGKGRDFVVMDVKKRDLSYSILTSSVRLSEHLNVVYKEHEKRHQCIQFEEFFKGC